MHYFNGMLSKGLMHDFNGKLSKGLMHDFKGKLSKGLMHDFKGKLSKGLMHDFKGKLSEGLMHDFKGKILGSAALAEADLEGRVHESKGELLGRRRAARLKRVSLSRIHLSVFLHLIIPRHRCVRTATLTTGFVLHFRFFVLLSASLSVQVQFITSACFALTQLNVRRMHEFMLQRDGADRYTAWKNSGGDSDNSCCKSFI